MFPTQVLNLEVLDLEALRLIVLSGSVLLRLSDSVVSVTTPSCTAAVSLFSGG